MAKNPSQIHSPAENHVAAIKAGLIDAKDLGFAEAERKPLELHVAEWRDALIAKGRCRSHAELSHNRVARIGEL